LNGVLLFRLCEGRGGKQEKYKDDTFQRQLLVNG
jgi:hypothetical protein